MRYPVIEGVDAIGLGLRLDRAGVITSYVLGTRILIYYVNYTILDRILIGFVNRILDLRGTTININYSSVYKTGPAINSSIQ